MNILTKEDLKTLTRRPGGVCISIYMPTHRVGRETQQDPIRLKNLLGEAEQGLLASGLRTPQVQALLEPAKKLLADSLFWQKQGDGLALFLSLKRPRFYRLPLAFEKLVLVADRFHIRPLLSILSGDGQFYILALSQKDVRLFQATRHSIGEVDLEGVPEGLAHALRFDDPEKQFQFHTGTRTPAGKGQRPAIFHGHGVGANDAKSNILRYFYKVDKGLQEVLRDAQAPLVLVGVDYLLPLYKEANTYPNLVANGGIEGNPEVWSTEELHRQAWRIVHPLFTQARRDATASYQELAGAGREQASSNVEETVPAACHGRVETLFVALGVQQWGTFDSPTNKVRLHQTATLGDPDLLDFAAVQTFLNGGTVYAVEPEKMPAGASIAAVFRY